MKLPNRPSRVPARDTRRVKPPAKVAAPFYGSSEWKALREAVVAERGAQCENPRCRRRGFVYLDHRVEIRDGGAPLDRSNLQLLCSPCHGAKTAQSRAARAHGEPQADDDA